VEKDWREVPYVVSARLVDLASAAQEWRVFSMTVASSAMQRGEGRDGGLTHGAHHVEFGVNDPIIVSAADMEWDQRTVSRG
jgi:hypothetical protein